MSGYVAVDVDVSGCVMLMIRLMFPCVYVRCCAFCVCLCAFM